MLSEEGERIYLLKVAEEKDFGVIVRKDIKQTEQCSSVIGRATGAMRKLKFLLKFMDAKIFK